MNKLGMAVMALTLMIGCSSGQKGAAGADSVSAAEGETLQAVVFDRDSAYRYVERQVAFGPRVPNTASHRAAGDWLVSELRRHGAEVTEQPMRLRAFDGTILETRNILGRYNPESADRLLLLAHWDCRPWADEDPDEGKRRQPVDGANDGASGVGVLLEIARQLGKNPPAKGVDILFVDAEDWGSDGDEDSWALGTQEFMANPPVANYMPKEAILLDMVGGKDARFYREYFSERAAPRLNADLWDTASKAGYAQWFVNSPGGAVNDDHLRLIEAGVPAVDIIEFDPEGEGFNEHWHTSTDNMEAISAETLGRVGTVVLTYLRKR